MQERSSWFDKSKLSTTELRACVEEAAKLG